MNTRRGKYFFGRVLKAGILTNEMIIDSLLDPSPIHRNKYSWTFTEVRELKFNKDSYYFGYLTKYEIEGAITKVDSSKKRQVEVVEPDLIIAISPFIYYPKYSGIVYLHVWNQIQQETFPKRFSDLVVEKYDNFFVDCEIEAIADLRSFFVKISQLSHVEEIKANVKPPNPLFGKYWKSLNEYLERRNIKDLNLQEKSKSNESLKTNIISIINMLLSEKEEEIEEVEIGDAAILMSADGYGHGKIIGVENGKVKSVSTKDSKLNILFEKDPNPEKLMEEVQPTFEKIKKERHMDHK